MPKKELPFAECLCEHYYEDHRDKGGACGEDLEDHNGRCPCPSFVNRTDYLNANS